MRPSLFHLLRKQHNINHLPMNVDGAIFDTREASNYIEEHAWAYGIPPVTYNRLVRLVQNAEAISITPVTISRLAEMPALDFAALTFMRRRAVSAAITLRARRRASLKSCRCRELWKTFP